MNRTCKNFFLFNDNDISSVHISVAAVRFAVTEGARFAVEFRGISAESVHCSVKSDSLFIYNTLKLPGIAYFEHSRYTDLLPRILLTVPSKKILDAIYIDSFASSVHTCGDFVKCNEAKIECRCGITDFAISSACRTELDCIAGRMKIRLNAGGESFLPVSVDSKTFAGIITEKGKDKNFFGSDFAGQKRDIHVSALCIAGRIDIDTDESNTGANAKPAVR